jgi:outer membrane protein assembly factor BamB
MKKSWLLLVAVGLSPFSGAMAADWPQWRGPERTGISQETGLLKEWPKDGPKLLWQVNNIGDGYSTPAISAQRIYLLSNKGMDNEFVQALSVNDGKQIWATRIGKVGPNKGPQYPAARSTPTVDGDLLYALGSDGDLACLESATGTVRWRKSLRADFGGVPGAWAYAESPLVDGDTLVCTPGGTGATLVALNKHSGDLIWKAPVPGGDPAAYASAIVVNVNGVKQYVQFLGKGLVGVDAKTGKFLWRYDQPSKGSPANIPTPVAQGPYVYCAGARTGGGVVKLDVENGEVKAKPVYFSKAMPQGIGGMVLLGDNLYGTKGQALICADFTTGKIRWEDKSVGPGAVCFADGRLYVHDEKDNVILVEATPEAFREKGRFKPPAQPDRGKSQAWAYPVIANGRLYIRDLGALWCYDVKDPQAAQ